MLHNISTKPDIEINNIQLPLLKIKNFNAWGIFFNIYTILMNLILTPLRIMSLPKQSSHAFVVEI